ncbi:MAG: FtsX-like permease family protein [bacterium]|nr:FtsX-like permease family protein [bacterium]
MKNNKPVVPFIAEKILRILARSEDEISLIGDFEEEYCSRLKEKGRLKAWIWYWINTFNSLPKFLSHSVLRGYGFFENYLKIAFRNILKQKVYSSINIMGLAIGMACCLLISLWVFDELSYDRFHENAENIYRVEADVDHGDRIFHTYSSPHQFVPLAKGTIPEVSGATRCTRFGGIQIKFGNSSYFERDVIAADPDIFQMFSFPFLEGDPATALSEPNSIVISERTAEKYFGKDESPLGKILSVENTFDFKVTGVLKNVPDNSSIRLDIVIKFDFVYDNLGRMPTRWVNAISNYVMIRDGVSENAAAEKITDLIRQNSDVESRSTYLLNPLTNIHLHTYRGYEKSMGYVQFVYIFSLIAVFVLINACINYMSLSTARSTKRAKEIGMRKVVGAYRHNIIKQFMLESILITFFGVIIAAVLVILILPAFNSFTGKSISLLVWTTPYLPVSILGIVLLTGIVSGSYPALFLSSFSPVGVLKNIGSAGTGKNRQIRKMLVVVQFVLSLTLIISTMVVYRQVDFMKNQSTGFNRNNLICIPLKEGINQNYDAVKNELIKNPGVLNVSALNRRPSNIGDFSRDVTWQGKKQGQEMTFMFGAVEHDFILTLGLKIISGRSFSKEFTNDRGGAYIVNEEAVKQMGVESPIGMDFSIMGMNGKIVGVMKDFHSQPLYEEIKPLVVFLSPNPNWMGNMLVRLGADSESVIEYINDVWTRMFPDYTMDYSYLAGDYERMYRNEDRLSTLLKYFTFLSVFIAFLGLLGLASYTAEQRTKEIGIRKVMGASVNGIIMLFYKDYVKLISYSILITSPIAYMMADSWLQKFAYRIDLNWDLFILTGLMTILISLAAVGFQALKAAYTDPVKTLKYE